jgi:uncharacterized membrane protein
VVGGSNPARLNKKEQLAARQAVLFRIVSGLATGAGILGIFGAIEVIRTWMIGG